LKCDQRAWHWPDPHSDPRPHAPPSTALHVSRMDDL
jgi:hypothetical protein